MRVFKTRGFARFTKIEKIGDDALARAIRQAEALGGGVLDGAGA